MQDPLPLPPGENYKANVPARMMLIGSVGCGKTSFMQRAQGSEVTYKKTQTSTYEHGFFDTPGEYVELNRFKHGLQITSYETDIIIFLIAAKDLRVKIPPGFTSYFNKPSVGVITKIDISTEEEIAEARNSLIMTGITPENIFPVSSYTGEGFNELFSHLHVLSTAIPGLKDRNT